MLSANLLVLDDVQALWTSNYLRKGLVNHNNNLDIETLKSAYKSRYIRLYINCQYWLAFDFVNLSFVDFSFNNKNWSNIL